MQGGRTNVGRATVPMSGKLATRLGGAPPRQTVGRAGQGQSTQLAPPVPASQATRHQPATPSGPPRSGSREVARVDSAGLVAAGQQTTGGQPVQQPQPLSPPQREVYPGQRS